MKGTEITHKSTNSLVLVLYHCNTDIPRRTYFQVTLFSDL